MGERGRKSAAQLSVAPQVIEVVPRPVAPGDLTDEQAGEWEAIVTRMPADWFPRETHGMLAQYCRHVVSARRVAQWIATMDADGGIDLDEYDKLLKMQEREGRAMSSLGTRLRITQQSHFDKERKRDKGKSGKRIWES